MNYARENFKVIISRYAIYTSKFLGSFTVNLISVKCFRLPTFSCLFFHLSNENVTIFACDLVTRLYVRKKVSAFVGSLTVCL